MTVISDFLQMLWLVIQYMGGAIFGGFVAFVLGAVLAVILLVIQYMGGAIFGGFVAFVLGAVLAVILDVAIDLATHGRNIRAKAAKEVRPVSVMFGMLTSAIVAAAMLLTAAKRFGWF